MFRSELRRAFLNPFFFLALMLGIVSIMGGVYQYTNGFRPLFPDEPLNTYNVFDGLLWGQLTIFPFFASLTATLPFGDSLITDQSSGYLRYALSRTNLQRYLSAKFLAVILSGIVATTLPSIIVFIGMHFFVSKELMPPDQMRFGDIESMILGTIYRPHPYLYVLWTIFLVLVYGFIYAIIAFLASLFVKNRYTVLVIPFLYNFLANFFLQNIGLGRWSPATQLIPYSMTEVTLTQVFLPYLFMIIACGLLIFYKARKLRLEM